MDGDGNLVGWGTTSEPWTKARDAVELLVLLRQQAEKDGITLAEQLAWYCHAALEYGAEAKRVAEVLSMWRREYRAPGEKGHP